MSKRNRRNNGTNNKEEGTMAPETSTVDQAPITMGDKTFASLVDLQKYLKDLQEASKAARALLKASKPVRQPRKPSAQQALGILAAEILNADGRVGTEMANLGLARITIWQKDGKVETHKQGRKATEGTGTRGSVKLVVDGTEYKSASAARNELLPELVGKSMNAPTIISKLEKAGHTVVRA